MIFGFLGEPDAFFMFILYSLVGGYLEYAAWKVGINAARYVDPTWNDHRGLLYPPFFYATGLAEDPPYPKKDYNHELVEIDIEEE